MILVLKKNTHHSDISEFVSCCDSVVIKYASGSNPPGMRIVGKDDQLVLLSLVPDGIHRLLHITSVDSLTDCINTNNSIWNMLVLAFSQ